MSAQCLILFKEGIGAVFTLSFSFFDRFKEPQPAGQHIQQSGATSLYSKSCYRVYRRIEVTDLLHCRRTTSGIMWRTLFVPNRPRLQLAAGKVAKLRRAQLTSAYEKQTSSKVGLQPPFSWPGPFFWSCILSSLAAWAITRRPISKH